MDPDLPITFRNHFASIFQSAVTEVGRRIQNRTPTRRVRGATAESQRPRTANEFAAVAADLMAERLEGRTPANFPAIRTRGLNISSATRTCASLALRYMEAYVSGDQDLIAIVRNEFQSSVCDPAWATTITEYLAFFGPTGQRAEIPYIPASEVGENPIFIKNGARVALVADWGTGAEPAYQILRQISKQSPDILVHLGDVYYSGTPAEYEQNFLLPITQVLGTDRQALPIFALSGNHDMYSGGVGYYATIKKLNPGLLGQKASFFCLRSVDQEWQLLAMDTGLNDYSPFSVEDCITYLRDDELDWHLRRIEEFAGKTILLSHHQLFSAFSLIGGKSQVQCSCNPFLLQAFSEARSKGQIPAWFWGHEHSLGIYEPYVGLGRGRCIGHGAVPVDGSENIYETLTHLNRPPKIKAATKLGLDGSVFAHGFALLTLGANGAPSRAEYYQIIAGATIKVFEEEIS